jgi:hypothetical protein
MKILKCVAIEKWSGIDQSHPIIQSLDDIVSWKVIPPFCKISRSAWLPLKEPIKVESPYGDIYVEALKIKGVGFLDYHGNIRQPTTEHLHRITSHLGITKEGHFSILKSLPAPIGGITIEKARAEYKTALGLIENGLPSSVPVRLYQYQNPELRYQTQEGDMVPMGVVVTGQLQRTFHRLDTILEYSMVNGEIKEELNRFAESMGISLGNDPELSLFRASYASYGHHLREFSSCGFYRYSSHCTNLGFSARRGSAYFTDLDSCLELVECSEIEKPMQVMRDAFGVIFYLIFTFLQPEYIQHFSRDRVFQSNLQRAFLTNYYCDVSVELIDELVEVLNECHFDLYQRAIDSQKHSSLAKEASISNTQGFLSDFNKGMSFWKSPWIHYEQIYCWLIAVTWTLHSHSKKMSTLYPFKITEEELYTNLSALSTSQIVEKIRTRIDRAIR